MPMNPFAAKPTRNLLAPLAATLLCLASQQSLAADEPDKDAPKGAAVTVLKAAKFCFAIVEVSGIVIPREETAVRPDRQGLKVAEILADAGDTVIAGQTLARLTLPEGGTVHGQAPVAGLIANSTAVIGGWPRAAARRCFRSSRAASSTWSGWCRPRISAS
jgi:HlyD family secretion protein